MLNRLFAAVAILSLIVAVIVAVLWWRSNHGHTDTFHLGAASPTQTWFETLPGGRVAIHIGERGAVGVHSDTYFKSLNQVLAGCFVVPALWGAILLRRRLLPRPPGTELPSLRHR